MRSVSHGDPRNRKVAEIWLNRYAKFLVAATLLLLAAGGMVTSTSSGLSVPDWPTTFGYSMFSFPFANMSGGIFYEHGHRLIASAVGLVTIGLVIFLMRVESRRWVTRLGFVALGAVVLQGLLGGLTVLYQLPPAVSIGHAALAQVFFCLTVSIATVTSPRWRAETLRPVDDRLLRTWMIGLTVLIYAQILIGATMRHLGAGLAIPDFPLSYGHLLPPAFPPPIAIHFTHRVGAVIVALLSLAMAAHAFWHHRGHRELTRVAWGLLAVVGMQITLGGLVVLTRKHPVINTLHVVNGAIVLGTALLFTLRTFRVRFVDSALGARR